MAPGAAGLTEATWFTLVPAPISAPRSQAALCLTEMAEVHVDLSPRFWNPVTGGLLEYVLFIRTF